MSSDKGQPDREQTGLIAQQNLKDVGVDAQIEQMDFNSYMGKWRQNRQFEAVNWYYVVPSSPDLTAYWSTGASLNEWGYSNPELDKLFAEARTVFEADKRKAVYDKAQEILADDRAGRVPVQPEGASGDQREGQGLPANGLPRRPPVHVRGLV